MPFTLSITVLDDGNMRLEGIPQNPIVGFGTLEIARHVLHGHYDKQSSQLVQPVSPAQLPPGFLGQN